jgi:thiol-disulfide isomerase/thioredoxin
MCVLLACCATQSRRSIPSMAQVISTTRVTVVAFGAAWCPPCTVLDAKIKDFAEKHPEVQVVKVDMTPFSEAETQSTLPDADAFPVVRVFDRNGHFIVQLTGADTFDFEKYVTAKP